MRAIKKQGSGGYHLDQSHAKPPQTKEEASSRWSGYGYKQDLLDRLLAEQYRDSKNDISATRRAIVRSAAELGGNMK